MLQCFPVFNCLFLLIIIISEAGITPTAIYTSLPPHQLPFLVFSSSLAKALTFKRRFPKACSADTCSHIQRRFRTAGFGTKLFGGKGTMEDP